jgi:D-glycero-D-manno-heptose 1,7-bisphosphate phosphatase
MKEPWDYMENKEKKNKAVFLDRDGVINIDHVHVGTIERFDFNEGIFKLLKRLQDNGYELIIVTNQAGISKGFFTLEQYEELTEHMLNRLKENGIEIRKVYHCPHKHEEKCKCRKPSPKFFLEAIKEFELDEERCIIVGDKDTDVLMGKGGPCKKILLNSRYSKDLDFKELKDKFNILKANNLKEVESLIFNDLNNSNGI